MLRSHGSRHTTPTGGTDGKTTTRREDARPGPRDAAYWRANHGTCQRGRYVWGRRRSMRRMRANWAAKRPSHRSAGNVKRNAGNACGHRRVRRCLARREEKRHAVKWGEQSWA